MKITLITVGKIKEKYFTMAVDEYKKRLGRYGQIEIIEVPDEKTPDGASEKEEILIREKEGQRILGKIKDGAYVIAMTIDGRAYDSVGLAGHIADLGVRGNSHLIFIIGGSLGLSPQVQKRADECISFSKLTFPHQLMRVILLEQIYRSFRIINKEPYHK